MASGSWQLIVVVWRHVVCTRRCLISQRLVQIFATQSEAVRWELVLIGLRVLLRRAVLLEFAWNAIDGQVFIHQVEVAGLDLLKHVVTQLANEPIVVLAADVNDEFFVSGLRAL